MAPIVTVSTCEYPVCSAERTVLLLKRTARAQSKWDDERTCSPNGRLTLTDNDTVSVSNLSRQFLFRSVCPQRFDRPVRRIHT